MKPMTMAARLATAALLMASTVLALAATNAPTASLWSRMWRTPDQRGQALLRQGDAAGAAQEFVDPQRKGHASLQAQDYAGASKTLSGVDTAEAHYNRGNALAHTGDLQGAIDAYDAALKLNPQHTDARHNRDVVAAALKKNKDEKQESSKQDQKENQEKQSKEDSKAGDKQDAKQDSKQDAKQDGKKDRQPEAKPDGKDGKPDAKPEDGKGGQSADKPDQKPGDKSEPKPNDKPGKQPSDKPGQMPPAKPGQQAGGPSVPAAPASSPKDDAAQARRDAEASLGKGAQPPALPQNGASAPAPGQPGATDAVKMPPTEKQIAQEQWLRAIPDDPGGLLRRKFLIEHMLRQQGQKP
ncbi:MAG: tetratricopeptide repeat protein [Burkholderiales bacterium]|nr:tetratricopeptide repeat protein [Burkholderiales bacterium]